MAALATQDDRGAPPLPDEGKKGSGLGSLIPILFAIGLFVEGRYGFGDARQADILAGLQIDGEIFALPFIFAYHGLFR